MSFSGRDSTWAPFSKLVSESGGNVQIGSLPNMERFHLGTVGSSTAGSLEAQLRPGKSTCTGLALACRSVITSQKTRWHSFRNQGANSTLASSPGQPVAMIRFADSPAVAGLEGDMSDDTIVDSELWSLIQILMSKSQLFTQALCCDSSSNGANMQHYVVAKSHEALFLMHCYE